MVRFKELCAKTKLRVAMAAEGGDVVPLSRDELEEFYAVSVAALEKADPAWLARVLTSLAMRFAFDGDLDRAVEVEAHIARLYGWRPPWEVLAGSTGEAEGAREQLEERGLDALDARRCEAPQREARRGGATRLKDPNASKTPRRRTLQ